MAANPAHGFTIRYDAAGRTELEVAAGDDANAPAHRIALEPVALGYGGTVEALAGPVSRGATGERVDTVWDGRLLRMVGQWRQRSGAVLNGEAAIGSVTVTNIGTGELTLSELVEPGAPFSITGGTCIALPVTLLPGESCRDPARHRRRADRGSAGAQQLGTRAPGGCAGSLRLVGVASG